MLGWVMCGLFLSNAVVGGISVKVKLAWVSVMGHFLLALALVAVALVMHKRAAEDDAPRRPIVAVRTLWLARAIYALTIWVLVAGTLVTAAGPHGGDIEAKRLNWPIADAARVHAVSVDILVVLVLVLVVALVRSRAPRPVLTAASAVLAAMVAQGVLGYVQYFEAIPAVLVGFHVFGAVLVFGTVQQLQLEMRAPVPGDVSANARGAGQLVRCSRRVMRRSSSEYERVRAWVTTGTPCSEGRIAARAGPGSAFQIRARNSGFKWHSATAPIIGWRTEQASIAADNRATGSFSSRLNGHLSSS